VGALICGGAAGVHFDLLVILGFEGLDLSG